MTSAGPPPRDDRALIVLVVGALVIGCGPVMVRLAGAGPSAIGFWRLAFALPVLALLSLREAHGVASLRPTGAMVIAGVLFAADLAFWHYGIHYTSLANATVLSNLTPIIVTAVAWIVFRERPRMLFLAGLALAVGGAVAMGLAKGGAAGPGDNPRLGDLLSATTAIWYSGYFLAVREARKTVGAPTVMLWSSIVAAPALVVAALLLREPLWPVTIVGWAACAGLGLMHVTGQGAIAWSLGRLPASLIAVVVLVQPVVAAALGWLVFGEGITPMQGLGALGVLAGVAVAQAASRPAPPPVTGEAEALA